MSPLVPMRGVGNPDSGMDVWNPGLEKDAGNPDPGMGVGSPDPEMGAVSPGPEADAVSPALETDAVSPEELFFLRRRTVVGSGQVFLLLSLTFPAVLEQLSPSLLFRLFL